jgi:hypothetical protein
MQMKKLLLATVATIALTASGVAAEQKGQAAGGAGAEMKAGSQTTGSGAEMKAGGHAQGQTSKPGVKAEGKAGADMKANGQKGAAEMKSGADTKGSASTKTRSETTGQGGANEPKANERPGQRNGSGMNRTEQRDQRQPGSNATDNRTGAQGQGAAQGTTAGQAGGTSVQLSSEQKTKIRTTVIQSASAPKIERSQINFSLNVGTVVPRTVKVVAVPATLIEIHPAWRGYSYFVVGDELVIVEPRTLKIVAVIVV